MIPELLLLSVFAGAAGTAVYLYREHVSSQRGREEEERSRLRKLEAEFRSALLQEIKSQRGQIDFTEYVERCEIPTEIADRVAQDLYLALCKKVVSDGVITETERAQLADLRPALGLSLDMALRIEGEAKANHYKTAVASALSDGQIGEKEANELYRLRRSIGLADSAAFQATESAAKDAYLALFRQVARDGVITSRERQELQRLKQALAINDAEGFRIIREEAINLYRRRHASIIQNADVTQEEEDELGWLQKETGLSHKDVAPYISRLEEVKRLGEYRKGNLPSRETSMMLEGGEICHWEGHCSHNPNSRTESLTRSNIEVTEDIRKMFARMGVHGELVVTSKRIIFISATKKFTIKPSRIMDIAVGSGWLHLKLDVKQGAGDYFLSQAEELEAILVGLAKRHKFLSAANYSSTKSRHIPDDVKRAVWDRDGGRCVRCKATDYLEYDHIIPYTKGGANTVNNIQILCRKCNALKSDRV